MMFLFTITVVQGKLYYIEAQHIQRARKDEENYLSIGLWLHKSHYHNYQTRYVRDEVQNIEMLYHRDLETQRITIACNGDCNGMSSGGGIKFTQSGKAAATTFSTAEATNKTIDWKQNFEAMLKVQCTYDVTNHFVANDFEDTDFALDGMGAWQTDQVDCYCGDRCMERQTRLFHKYHNRKYIDALKYSFICFAVKGTTFTGRVQVLYRWQDQRNRQRRDWIHFNHMWEPSAEWQHVCVDWKSLGQNSSLSWIAKDDQMKDGSYLKIEDFILQVTDNDEYYSLLLGAIVLIGMKYEL